MKVTVHCIICSRQIHWWQWMVFDIVHVGRTLTLYEAHRKCSRKQRRTRRKSKN